MLLRFTKIKNGHIRFGWGSLYKIYSPQCNPKEKNSEKKTKGQRTLQLPPSLPITTPILNTNILIPFSQMFQWCIPKILAKMSWQFTVIHLVPQYPRTNWMSCDFLNIITGEGTRNKASNAYCESKICILKHRVWTSNDICSIWFYLGNKCLPLHHCLGRVNHSQTHCLSPVILMVACNVLSKNCVIFWTSQAMNRTSKNLILRQSAYTAYSQLTFIGIFIQETGWETLNFTKETQQAK